MEEPQNGNSNLNTVAEEEPVIGPGPAPRSRSKRLLQLEQAYTDSPFSANMYEKSLCIVMWLLISLYHLQIFSLLEVLMLLQRLP
ncbi:hypothetical protein CRYUN_Cryun11dG0107800 [Craigia yunnanensis]